MFVLVRIFAGPDAMFGERPGHDLVLRSRVVRAGSTPGALAMAQSLGDRVRSGLRYGPTVTRVAFTGMRAASPN